MFKLFKEEIDFGGKKIILEPGKIARQADGAIIDNTSDSFSLSYDKTVGKI